jgi:hypothetical protein
MGFNASRAGSNEHQDFGVMTRLYAYKSYINTPKDGAGWLISWSENPPEKCTISGAVPLGYVDLQVINLAETIRQ